MSPGKNEKLEGPHVGSLEKTTKQEEGGKKFILYLFGTLNQETASPGGKKGETKRGVAPVRREKKNED